MNKEQVNKKLRTLAAELEYLELLENRNPEQEKRIDEAIVEFQALKMEPVNMDGLRTLGEGNNNSSSPEFRAFNKDNLNELGGYIRSKGIAGMRSENLSLGRFVRGLVLGDWKGAEAEKRLVGTETRTALGTATSGGGWLVPEEIFGPAIQLAMNKTQVIAAGSTIIPMSTKTLTIPKVLTPPEALFKAENAAWGGDLDALTFTGIELSSKSIMSLVSLSVELAQDGVGISNTIQEAMTSAIALAIDKACLLGITSGPAGLVNTADVQTEALTSPLADYGPFSRAWAKIEAQNGTSGALIAASSVYGDLDLLTAGTDGQPLQPPESWKSYEHFSSNQLTDMAILGDFSQLVIGMHENMNIEISRQSDTAMKNMQVWIRIYCRMDSVLKNAKHFVVLQEASS